MSGMGVCFFSGAIDLLITLLSEEVFISAKGSPARISVKRIHWTVYAG